MLRLARTAQSRQCALRDAHPANWVARSRDNANARSTGNSIPMNRVAQRRHLGACGVVLPRPVTPPSRGGLVDGSGGIGGALDDVDAVGGAGGCIVTAARGTHDSHKIPSAASFSHTPENPGARRIKT